MTTATPVAHGSDEFRDIATRHTILRGQVGSGLHGVTVGDDDRDEMGICIEPPEYVIGNRRFEQYQYRTQPEGVRSGAGDLDLVVYSLRKWARLAADGNPTVLLMMFIPKQELVLTSGPGRDLQAHPERFISRQAAWKFRGYLMSQREKMTGDRAQRTNRPELIERYGFDTKFAYHAIRLGIQGVELLTEGRIHLPMREPARTQLTDLRLGRYTKEAALDEIDRLAGVLEWIGKYDTTWPEYPDRAGIDRWLTDTYTEWWNR